MLVVKLVLVYSCPVYAVALKKHIKKHITTIMSALTYWYKINKNTDFPENCRPNTGPTEKNFSGARCQKRVTILFIPYSLGRSCQVPKKKSQPRGQGKFTRKY